MFHNIDFRNKNAHSTSVFTFTCAPMTDTLHYLHPRSQSFIGFLRIGHTGHRKLEALLASGRLPFGRMVFDAAYIGGQKELLGALSAAGREIVLDSNNAGRR
jgi:hypothetical protein